MWCERCRQAEAVVTVTQFTLDVAETTANTTTVNSHAWIYRLHVDTLAYKRFEPAAGLATGNPIGRAITRLHTEAYEDSKAMDRDSTRNTPKSGLRILL